jgi:hypothetical protein
LRIRKNRESRPNAVHCGPDDGDVVFFTVTDSSHSLHGIKAG